MEVKSRIVSQPPVGEQSIVMSVSVCLSVCVFVCPRSYLLSDLRLIFCACYLWSWLGPPQSGGVVICYVFPVLWMTSYFAHKLKLLDVAAQLKRSALAALGLAINCVQ